MRSRASPVLVGNPRLEESDHGATLRPGLGKALESADHRFALGGAKIFDLIAKRPKAEEDRPHRFSRADLAVRDPARRSLAINHDHRPNRRDLQRHLIPVRGVLATMIISGIRIVTYAWIGFWWGHVPWFGFDHRRGRRRRRWAGHINIIGGCFHNSTGLIFRWDFTPDDDGRRLGLIPVGGNLDIERFPDLVVTVIALVADEIVDAASQKILSLFGIPKTRKDAPKRETLVLAHPSQGLEYGRRGEGATASCRRDPRRGPRRRQSRLRAPAAAVPLG